MERRVHACNRSRLSLLLGQEQEGRWAGVPTREGGVRPEVGWDGYLLGEELLVPLLR